MSAKRISSHDSYYSIQPGRAGATGDSEALRLTLFGPDYRPNTRRGRGERSSHKPGSGSRSA